jgi:hypothetical protein
MRKLFLILLAGAMLSFSCNQNDGKNFENVRRESENNGKDSENEDNDDTNSQLKKSAIQYCACLSEAYTDLDPQLKELMIQTADTKDPAVSMADELKQKDGDEYEMLMSEIKSMATNADAKACVIKLKKQTDIDVDDDVEGLRSILKMMQKGDDCEFAASVTKHSINSKERRHKREKQNSE